MDFFFVITKSLYSKHTALKFSIRSYTSTHGDAFSGQRQGSLGYQNPKPKKEKIKLQNITFKRGSPLVARPWANDQFAPLPPTPMTSCGSDISEFEISISNVPRKIVECVPLFRPIFSITSIFEIKPAESLSKLLRNLSLFLFRLMRLTKH